MAGLVSFFYELRDYSRFQKLERKYRRVVFYAEDAESFVHFEGLIDDLVREYDLSISYITSDSTDPILKSENPNIQAFYIKYFIVNFIISLDTDVLIMTMPDLNNFHIKRSKHVVNHLYIFHNIGSAFSTLRYGALFHYDTIFCVGPHHKEEIQRQDEVYDLDKTQLVEFGYYKLEKVYREYQDYKAIHSDQGKKSNYKARILLAPTWGDDSILNVCGKELIGILLEANYEVIVRPHPMTRSRDPRLIESLNNAFERSDNYHYEGDVSSTDSFYESDLLISDWSGVSYEYAFGTERPVLFVDVPQKIVNPRYLEVGIEPVDSGLRSQIGEVLALDELDRADYVIAELISNMDAYIEKIRSARREFLYNFGNSSRAGATYIRDCLMDGADTNKE